MMTKRNWQIFCFFFVIGCSGENSPVYPNWGEWCGIAKNSEVQPCTGGPFSCLIDKIDIADGGSADGICFEICTEDNDCGNLVLTDTNPYISKWKCIEGICNLTCDDLGKGCFESDAGPLYCVNNLCTLRKPDGYSTIGD